MRSLDDACSSASRRSERRGGQQTQDRSGKGERTDRTEAFRSVQRSAGNRAAGALFAPGRPAPPAVPVQRMEYGEQHQHPSGPAVRVRGPRKSKTANPAKEQVKDAQQWKAVEDAARAGGTPVDKERVETALDPQTLFEQNRSLRNAMVNAGRESDDNRMAMQHGEVLEDIGRKDQATSPYWRRQDRRDAALTEAAKARAAGGALANQVVRAMIRPGDGALNDVTQHVAASSGVILDGGHAQSRTWAFLIGNIAQLRAAGVRTIYLESLRDDSYQRHVDEFMQFGRMPPGLDSFVEAYDRSHTLGVMGMRTLLEVARAAGLRIRAVDGRPARRPKDSNMHARAALMNTYAEQVVRNDHASSGNGAGKYVMELGAAHSGEHTGEWPQGGANFPKRFPGLAQLLDIPALSWADE